MTEKRSVASDSETFLWLKGLVEALFTDLNIGSWEIVPEAYAWLETACSGSIKIGKRICGNIGLLNRSIRNAHRLTEPVAVMEISIDPLLRNLGATPSFTPYAVYPPVSRDIAILIHKTIKHTDILKVILDSAPKELETVELFDIFDGEGIRDDKKEHGLLSHVPFRPTKFDRRRGQRPSRGGQTRCAGSAEG